MIKLLISKYKDLPSNGKAFYVYAGVGSFFAVVLTPFFPILSVTLAAAVFIMFVVLYSVRGYERYKEKDTRKLFRRK